ncbi:MAG: response regulator [Actinobacteria bacterium]|nr:response regulator [Actinomycetota bacterium]
MAARAAHDFNNLLQVIIGMTDIIKPAAKANTVVDEGLSEIRAAAERANALTRKLLAFSRRQPLAPKVFHLDRLVLDMCRLLRPVTGEDIELVVVSDPSPVTVEAVPGQIEQVLMNLAINARDAMPHGGKISIETTTASIVDIASNGRRPDVGSSPYAMLVFSDAGSGMVQEAVTHAFEPFYTTKDAEKGTGLGLSIVYGIVKQSGGEISIESETGKSTTLKIYLPSTSKPAVWAPAGRRDAAPIAPDGGCECILVVEDEPAVRSLVARILKSKGYGVLEACSFEEGVATAAEHPDAIDLVLTDLVLPGRSGYQLAQELSRRREGSLKALFMSGHPRDTLVADGRVRNGDRVPGEALHAGRPPPPDARRAGRAARGFRAAARGLGGSCPVVARSHTRGPSSPLPPDLPGQLESAHRARIPRNVSRPSSTSSRGRPPSTNS